MSKTVVIGIDPGPEESAYILWDGSAIVGRGNAPNHDILMALIGEDRLFAMPLPTHCAIEQLRGFGIMASNGLFDTCHWTGRFLQAFGEKRTTLIPRKDVAKHICANSGASHDKFIREALITRFGGTESIAIGKKASQGPLYGVSGHLWPALAVALTWSDRNIGSFLFDAAEFVR